MSDRSPPHSLPVWVHSPPPGVSVSVSYTPACDSRVSQRWSGVRLTALPDRPSWEWPAVCFIHHSLSKGHVFTDDVMYDNDSLCYGLCECLCVANMGREILNVFDWSERQSQDAGTSISNSKTFIAGCVSPHWHCLMKTKQ